MAVTLYGDQATHTCSTCAYEYARGIAPEEVENTYRNPGHTIRLRCPNCDTMFDHIPSRQIRRPSSGDRILVQKWLFGAGGRLFGPNRWDVTVFKDPRDGTTNFIKRLVGLPGEVLEIIDGDVYTAPIELLDAKEPGLVAELDALRQRVYHLTQADHSTLPAHLAEAYQRVNRRLLPYLRIRRKTPRAQESLWFNVYNHDFLPAADSSGQQPTSVGWWPDSDQEGAARAWDTSQPEISFASEDNAPLAIEFDGKSIDDFVAYNYAGAVSRGLQGAYDLGDLRLRFLWFPDAGNGSISLKMNRDRDTFVAELHRDGAIAIERHGAALPGKRQIIGQTRFDRPFPAGRAVRIEFTNVDYCVALKVNGEEVIASTGAQYSPDLAHGVAISSRTHHEVLPAEVRITARDLHCRLRHLVLERDVYYRSAIQPQEGARDALTGSTTQNPYYRWPGWGTAGQPILLRPDRVVDGRHYSGEYYMLGDNSPASKDSRLWWEIGPHLQELGPEYQVGTVPGDQLIGKAFFVYWPAGYRPAWAPGIGLIPNFGLMRWIR
jgi:signal peptidase I